MAEYRLTTPLTDEDIAQLKAGDVVYLTGTIYTGRDAAHKRFVEALDKGEDLPFDIKGALIYYVGPSPAPPGKPIGSAGPTTSYRMDTYAPRLHSLGLKGTIGKGKRSDAVKDALKEHTAAYFGATGGAGTPRSSPSRTWAQRPCANSLWRLFRSWWSTTPTAANSTPSRTWPRPDYRL
jgi:fumarate hydratase subunit beta